jgi:hypothetical protein
MPRQPRTYRNFSWLSAVVRALYVLYSRIVSRSQGKRHLLKVYLNRA